jgi:hypothetical protein
MRARAVGWCALGLAVLGAGGACTPERTMIVVRVDSDLTVPDALDSVEIVVTHAGKSLQDLSFSLAPGKNTLPLQVGLLSPSGGGADVEIDVTGSHLGAFVVSQQAITSFVRGKSLLLEMFLAAECAVVDCGDANKTCTTGGRCIDKTRVAASLPEFDPHAPRDAAVGGTAGAVDAPPADAAGEGGSSGTGDAAAGAAGSGGLDGGAVDAGPDVTVDAQKDLAVEAAPDVHPGCVPRAEDCYNGLDDDCDGLADCADPDCTPTSVCIPLPSGSPGTTIATGATCPGGFAPQANGGTPYGLTVASGGTACTGCQCGSTRVTDCTAMLTTYASTADCQAGVNGRTVTTPISIGPDPCPVPDTGADIIFGVSLSPWTVSSVPCPASGTPVKPTASFATGGTFCRSAFVSANGQTGCAAGSVCTRRPPAGDAACVMLDDASTCPAGTKTTTVYTSIQDDRTCAPCACDIQGASCDAVVLQLGSDSQCTIDAADVLGGSRTCMTTQPQTGVSTPGYHLAGTVADGTCKPRSALSGALAPSGARSICCLP